MEIVLVDWSRLSRDFFGFLAVVNALSKHGAVFTVLGDQRYQQYAPREAQDGLMLAIEAFGAHFYREKISKATKAKLDYLKSTGVQLGRPEKLAADDLEVIRALNAQGLGSQRIADALTRSRVAVAAKKDYATKADRDKALRHARVSKSLIVPALREVRNEELAN